MKPEEVMEMGQGRRWQGDRPGENGTMTVFVRESDEHPGTGWRRGSGSFTWRQGEPLVDCDEINIHPISSLDELDKFLPGATWTELH